MISYRRCGLSPSASRVASSQWVTSCKVLNVSCTGSSASSSFAPFSSAMGWSDLFLVHPSIVIYLHRHRREPPKGDRQVIHSKATAHFSANAVAARWKPLQDLFLASAAGGSARQDPQRSAEVSQGR